MLGRGVEGNNKDGMTWAILATGPSMTQELADYVRNRCKTVAISDAYKLAPWATVLVSNDRSWWECHKDAYQFSGRKMCSHGLKGVDEFREHVPLGRNSGLMGMCAARALGAKRLLLLGFDMHGTHFFGTHPAPLKNSTERIFQNHIKQFDGFSGCEVLNCTVGSRLTRFPFANVYEVL